MFTVEHRYASRIQSAWHKFMGRKELVTLRATIGDTYQSKGKARSRGSVFRPFDGTYLMVNQGFVEENDAMQRILDWYVVFERGVLLSQFISIISLSLNLFQSFHSFMFQLR